MATKPKCPYTFPHKSRKAKVDYLTSIGGYYADRHARFPIEFTVSVSGASLDFDSLWAGIEKEHQGEIPEAGTRERALFKSCAQKAYKDSENYLWQSALEDTARDLHDTCTYKMLWDSSEPLDVEFGLYGRGGKHLCISSVGRVTLAGKSEETLEELLLLQRSYCGYYDIDEEYTLRKGWEWEVSTKSLDTLYRYIRQCEIDFTSAKAAQELEHQATWRLHQDAASLYENLFGETPETATASLKESAALLYTTLNSGDDDHVSAFRSLCAAAGVDITELLD